MPTQNVNLSEQQVTFIRKRIEQGSYRNASEILRAGLRLLEQQEKQDQLKLKRLRRLATAAFDEIDRGEYETVDSAGIDLFIEKVDARARASKRR